MVKNASYRIKIDKIMRSWCCNELKSH